VAFLALPSRDLRLYGTDNNGFEECGRRVIRSVVRFLDVGSERRVFRDLVCRLPDEFVAMSEHKAPSLLGRPP
jgi:hypothetical protein